MNLRLLVTEGPLSGSVFPLAEGVFRIGRSSDSQISIPDRAASREHCLLRYEDQRVTLKDCGSHNGTLVNGEVASEREIHPGDTIRIGNTVLLLSIDDEARPPSSRTIQIRPEDSIYLSSHDWPDDATEPDRQARDMRLLLRLSSLLHSLRLLRSLPGQASEHPLAAHLIALLTDIIPSARAAVLTRSGIPAKPYATLAASSEATDIDTGLFQHVAAQGVAVASGRSMAAPVVINGETEAVLYFTRSPGQPEFDDGSLQLLTAVAGMTAVAWENVSLLDWLSQENERLREELNLKHDMVGSSARMLELQKQIARAAPSASTVLILGESGSGKELIARAIHKNSPRAAAPFVAINCAALTDTLLESELFGYEKGAFTGALAQRKGKLEAAQGGTVFLDEIGELSLLLQAKLLRVLQERELQRVGGTQTIKLDIRLVAATNRDLAEAARTGTFRQDLYYRLNVVSLKAPSLRQRPEDILPLAEHFAKKFAAQSGRKLSGISPAARAYLQSYSWPGNVRELENAIERAVVLGASDIILPEDLPENIREERPAQVSATLYEEAVETAKRQVVLRAFEQAGHEHEQAAKLLGLHPNYLHRLIKALDLRPALKAARRT